MDGITTKRSESHMERKVFTRGGKCVGIYCDQPAKVMLVLVE
jgi:hypothetical protein